MNQIDIDILNVYHVCERHLFTIPPRKGISKKVFVRFGVTEELPLSGCVRNALILSVVGLMLMPRFPSSGCPLRYFGTSNTTFSLTAGNSESLCGRFSPWARPPMKVRLLGKIPYEGENPGQDPL